MGHSQRKMAAANGPYQRGRDTTGSNGSTSVVTPVFVKVVDMPQHDYEYTVTELCRACEDVSGIHTMEGAQRIAGLWRLYPRSLEARANLLVSGISLSGIQVDLKDTNPYQLFNSNGNEVPTTRVVIGDVPLSCSNDDINDALLKLGCSIHSQIKYELDRDGNGKLTRFKTGRRFVFIAIPKDPLPKELRIGIFKARIYHREQRLALQRDNRSCYNCMEKGHVSFNCPNPVVCRACKLTGHRQHDAECSLGVEQGEIVATGYQDDRELQSGNQATCKTGAQSVKEGDQSSEHGDQSASPHDRQVGEDSAEVKKYASVLSGSSADDKTSNAAKEKSKTDNNKGKVQTTITSHLQNKRPQSPDEEAVEKKQRKDVESDASDAMETEGNT